MRQHPTRDSLIKGHLAHHWRAQLLILAGALILSVFLSLQATPTGRDDWRLGLTASKKTGNAVRRNRARRRLRALARTELAGRARTGTDYVIIARHNTAERPWNDLVGDLHKALGYLHRVMDKHRVMEKGGDAG